MNSETRKTEAQVQPSDYIRGHQDVRLSYPPKRYQAIMCTFVLYASPFIVIWPNHSTHTHARNTPYTTPPPNHREKSTRKGYAAHSAERTGHRTRETFNLILSPRIITGVLVARKQAREQRCASSVATARNANAAQAYRQAPPPVARSRNELSGRGAHRSHTRV